MMPGPGRAPSPARGAACRRRHAPPAPRGRSAAGRAPRSPGVLEHVGERLFEDPVRRRVHSSGSGRSAPSTSSRIGRPRSRKVATSSSTCCSDGAGRREVGRGGLHVAQDRHDPAQLGQALLAALLDPAQGVISLIGAVRTTSRAPRTPSSITVTVWPTRSCSSRAIAARSRCTAIWSSWARSRSRYAVRSSRAET